MTRAEQIAELDRHLDAFRARQRAIDEWEPPEWISGTFVSVGVERPSMLSFESIVFAVALALRLTLDDEATP